MATFTKTVGGTKAIIRKSGYPAVSKTFRTARDAKDWARTVEDQMVRDVYIDRGREAARLTLSAALVRYLSEVTSTKAKGTQRAEQTSARALSDRLGLYSLAALTPKVISDYRDSRLGEFSKRWKRPITASTVRIELAMLSHLFETAIKEWQVGLQVNPVKAIRKPPAHAGRSKLLNWSELKRLLIACQRYSQPMIYWIVILALRTGMRSGEITGLTLDQVDLRRRVVRLARTKNGQARTVPLDRRATKIITAAISNPLRPTDTRLVFFGTRGHKSGKINPYLHVSAWRKITLTSEINDLRFHDLRHMAVTRLVERGLSDQEVSAISGHQSMQMLRRYTHLRGEDLVGRLDRPRRI